MLRTVRTLADILPSIRKSLPILLAILMFSPMLEAFGTDIMGPFVAVATNPAKIHDSSLLSWEYQEPGLLGEDAFIITLSELIVVVLSFTENIRSTILFL